MNRLVLVVLLSVCGAAACDDPAISPVTTGDGTPGSGGAGGGRGSGTAGTGEPARPAPLPPAPLPAPSSPPPPGTVTPATMSCATSSHAAEALPVDLFFLFDASGSMATATVAGGPSKWVAARDAVSAFLSDPRSAGVGAGIQFFPPAATVPTRCTMDAECGDFGPCRLPAPLMVCSQPAAMSTAVRTCSATNACPAGSTCGAAGQCAVTGRLCANLGMPCGADPADSCGPRPGTCVNRNNVGCRARDYERPAAEIGVLPAAGAKIIDAMTRGTPSGNTPMGPAIGAALTHLRAHAAATPDRRTALVLVGDGVPTTCAADGSGSPRDVPMMRAALEAARNASPPIPTFVVGVLTAAELARMPPTAGAMALIGLAASGGTGAPLFVAANEDLKAKLLTALNEIRAAALPCEYPVPTSSGGMSVDFGRVNVSVATSAGERLIGFVPDRAACTERGGWHYDVDPATGTPRTIFLCESTCRAVKAEAKAKLDIVLGCKTLVE